MVDVAAEYDGGNALLARYVHGFGLVSRVAANGSAAFYGFDGTGHTRQMTDAGGSVVNRYDYDPFGVMLSASEGVANPFGYVGQFGVMRDLNGQSYMRAREYDAQLGRFTSVDPLRFIHSGWSRYHYSRNNPALLVDPGGLLEVDWSQLIVGVAKFAAGIAALVGFVATLPAAAAVAAGAATASAAGLLALNALLATLLFAGGVTSGVGNIVGAFQAGQATWPDIFELIGSEFGQLGGMIGRLLDALSMNPKSLIDLIADLAEHIDENKELIKRLLKELLKLMDDFFFPPAFGFVLAPADPNEKLGPTGLGPKRYIKTTEDLRYTIFFENVITATAPAQEVVIIDMLDLDLDWTTFRPTEIAFNNRVIPVNAQAGGFHTRITIPDHRPEVTRTWALDIAAGVDYQTGKVTWTFRTLDPLTNDLPEDALSGFLPPNDASYRGEGHVAFTVRPKPTLARGIVISNQASITFDAEQTVTTNIVTNTTCRVTLSTRCAQIGQQLHYNITDAPYN
ncbi:MAG: RHS repeat-associated core domain-containing protein [Anaerolineae bacterium]|nr:RHS repeat-associated core domain-containing protein [Anaerolineae bacterium]